MPLVVVPFSIFRGQVASERAAARPPGAQPGDARRRARCLHPRVGPDGPSSPTTPRRAIQGSEHGIEPRSRPRRRPGRRRSRRRSRRSKPEAVARRQRGRFLRRSRTTCARCLPRRRSAASPSSRRSTGRQTRSACRRRRCSRPSTAPGGAVGSLVHARELGLESDQCRDPEPPRRRRHPTATSDRLQLRPRTSGRRRR